jgi:acyl CoA:acetate/3-ketoacid CoA transferase beta subunit
VCVAACADLWRGDGPILASATVGYIPYLGVRLARATFEPDLLITDGEAALVANVLPLGAPASERVVEGYVPYRDTFHHLWAGRRHVIMGASQIDRFGNQNIACIGPWERPKAQLIGVRGAPGNTVNHTTSYWIPNHSRRGFVEQVDFVSGIGYDRAAAAGPGVERRHNIRRVVTNLCVLDFETPDCSMRLRSIHPGVTLEEVVEATGFALAIPANLPESRSPTADELHLIQHVLDPAGLRLTEVR